MSDPYQQYYELSSPLVPSSALRQEMYAAHKAGSYAAVFYRLNHGHLDARASIAINRENPLKTLMLLDEDPNAFSYQTLIAAKLIEKGCELRLHDRLFMHPADYALLSRNTLAATEILIHTVEQFARTGRPPYIPNIEGYFITEPDEDKRRLRFNAAVKNHATIGFALISMALDSSRTFRLSAEQFNYWRADFPYSFEALPAPSTALRNAFKAHSTAISDVWDGVPDASEVSGGRRLNLGERFQQIHEATYKAIVAEILARKRHEPTILG